MRRIFDHYTRERIGARSIAMRLNADGYRTAARRDWSHRSVLTVLGNRAYLGQTSFRDTTTADTHPAIIDREIFERAQRILAQRSRTYAKRAANGSDYLLAGLLRCTSCDTRFIGNAAHGRNRRYRYYTCHTRHRYGPTACNADRLPANDLDDAIVTALIDTYGDTDLVANAVARSQQRNHTLRAQHQAEHRAVTAEIVTAEQAIDRLLGAFETPKPSAATASVPSQPNSATYNTAATNSQNSSRPPTRRCPRTNRSPTPTPTCNTRSQTAATNNAKRCSNY